MRYFCTLFDKTYLYQGLALFKSLEASCSEFTLYALCMDEVAYNLISKTGRPNLIPILLAKIETDESKAIKQRITRWQYCALWQPLICLYILDQYKVEMITYLDADIMFFNDPEILFKELDNYSVSMVLHRYTPAFDKTATSGRFCVQFNAFRNNKEAREVLRYWKECCFKLSKKKPGYFLGQLSLDSWTAKFAGVRVIQHLGAGVAPWNIQQYEITENNEKVMVNGNPIVFYHFHEYAWGIDGRPFFSNYPLSDRAVQYIYHPYTTILREIETWVQSLDPTFHYRKEVPKPNLRGILVSYLPGGIRRYLRETLKPRLRKI